MFKQLMVALTIALAFTSQALAGDWSTRANKQETQSIAEIRAASAASSWTAVRTSDFIGGTVYQWEIICTDDDAVDFSLATKAPDGVNYTPIGSVTTTAANDTDGLADVGLFSEYLVAADALYYKLENISAGTCSIRLIKWDK